MTGRPLTAKSTTVRIPAGRVELEGTLAVPDGASGVVAFVHGSGSSRYSPRNQWVASTLRESGLATLLFDLLSETEDLDYAARFDIGLLAERVVRATDWVMAQHVVRDLKLGYFGASTGAAAALEAATLREASIAAVVSRGGRPDLAMKVLDRVAAPTLFIVGELDSEVRALNEKAFRRLTCEKDYAVVPGATHLFEEPGALDEVARLAAAWFEKHLVEIG